MPAVAPQSPIARALDASGEDVGDQRERRREHERGAESHEAAREDQLPGARRQAAGDTGEAEHGEAAEQHPLAPEPVGEAAGGEQEGGEDEVVGVDDPLQLAIGGVQPAHERRQRDVDDRGVEVDREGGEEQGREDEAASVHATRF
jgi:hypothetical protein